MASLSLTNLARAAYLADPTSQSALDQLRHTAADLQQHRQQQAATVRRGNSTRNHALSGCARLILSRQPQMLSELGSYCMSTGINPPTTFTTYTSSGSKLPS